MDPGKRVGYYQSFTRRCGSASERASHDVAFLVVGARVFGVGTPSTLSRCRSTHICIEVQYRYMQ